MSDTNGPIIDIDGVKILRSIIRTDGEKDIYPMLVGTYPVRIVAIENLLPTLPGWEKQYDYKATIHGKTVKIWMTRKSYATWFYDTTLDKKNVKGALVGSVFIMSLILAYLAVFYFVFTAPSLHEMKVYRNGVQQTAEITEVEITGEDSAIVFYRYTVDDKQFVDSALVRSYMISEMERGNHIQVWIDPNDASFSVVNRPSSAGVTTFKVSVLIAVIVLTAVYTAIWQYYIKYFYLRLNAYRK